MRSVAFAVVAAGVGAAAGCHTQKHDVSVPVVEEYRVAPDSANYNTPPEQGYTKPPLKKDFKPGMGGPGMGGGGGPGGGMGAGRGF